MRPLNFLPSSDIFCGFLGNVEGLDFEEWWVLLLVGRLSRLFESNAAFNTLSAMELVFHASLTSHFR